MDEKNCNRRIQYVYNRFLSFRKVVQCRFGNFFLINAVTIFIVNTSVGYKYSCFDSFNYTDCRVT